MFAEITYICKKCGNTFLVADTTNLKSNQISTHPCPQCSSTKTEKIEVNLLNRKK